MFIPVPHPYTALQNSIDLGVCVRYLLRFIDGEDERILALKEKRKDSTRWKWNHLRMSLFPPLLAPQNMHIYYTCAFHTT